MKTLTFNTPNNLTNHPNKKHTIYVFIRMDLSAEQQMVQVAHAAAEASRHFYRPEHGIASLIVLSVANSAALYKAQDYLDRRGLENTVFFEPDWDMGHSALATRPVLDEERPLFRAWQLWRLRTPVPVAAGAEGVAA